MLPELVYISHNIYGEKCLISLLKFNNIKWKLKLVITRENNKSLSDQSFKFDELIDNKIPILKVQNLKNVDINYIASFKANILLVFGWSQIIPKNILDLFELALGTHPSLLPKFRGNSAIPWHILLEEKTGGLSLFKLEDKVDTGDIYYQDIFEITERDTSHDIYDKYISAGEKMIEHHLYDILCNDLKIILNKNIPESLLLKRVPSDSKINWSDFSRNIDKLIRAMSFPYPLAFSWLKNNNSWIKVEFLETSYKNHDNTVFGLPGTIFIRNSEVNIICGQGILIIDDIIYNGIKYKAINYLKHNSRFITEFNKNDLDNSLDKKQLSNHILKYKNNKKILVIVAHADDEAYGCGGFLYLLNKYGYETYVLVLTESCSTQYSTTDLVSLKKEEAENVRRILNIKEYFFADLIDMKLDSYPEVEVTKVVEKYIRLINPYMVITHSDSDLNKDHLCVNKSVLVATRPSSGVQKILSMEVLSTTELGTNTFNPNKFIDISDCIEIKIYAINCYKTELRSYPHGRNAVAVKSLASFRGICSNFNYAEAFKVIKDYSCDELLMT